MTDMGKLSDIIDTCAEAGGKPFSRRWFAALNTAGDELVRVYAADEDEAWLLVERALCQAGRPDLLISWWAGGDRLEVVR